MQIKENTIFDSHYKLVRLLGSGGFSEVWLAEDIRIDSLKVALKIYAPGSGLDDQSAKSFRDEYSLVFNLVHTNLLCPASYGVFNGMPYLVLPFCERGSSSKLTGNISEEEAWQFLHDVAAGLAYLHKQNPPVIHQDIKPANVLIAKDGAYMITDFGISTEARNTLRKSVSTVNNSGGTIAYMAPERFSKTPDSIKASDIWALGASLFELITGNIPFGNMGGVIQKSGAEIPYIKNNISTDLKNIITLCLQEETWNRPTAEEILKWTELHFNKEKIRFGRKYKKIIAPGRHKKTAWALGIIIAGITLSVFFNGILNDFQKKQEKEALQRIEAQQRIEEQRKEAEQLKADLRKAEQRKQEEQQQIAEQRRVEEQRKIAEQQQQAEQEKQKEQQRKIEEKARKEQEERGRKAKVGSLLITANAAFDKAKYEEAFNLYLQVKGLDKTNTEGHTKFLNKAKSLIELVGYDNNVKALLLKAQKLNDTSEVRKLINNCD
ncbi:MAG: protein kinase [Dysgonamonadaceae bacterium]|jgi:serine/threonine protein kinase|nr:protein kinase [Dysgonamonadaceae bacterium]